MKFLHVIIPTKRMMETYIRMIREHYPVEDHTFYFLGKCPDSEKSLFEYGNVIELSDGKNKIEKIRNFYKDLSSYDYIMWHCLTLSPKFILFFTVFSSFLKNMIWVIWGIDLYSYKRPVQSFKDRIVNWLSWKVRKNIKYVVAIFPTDIPAYQKMFHKRNLNNIYYAPYPMREKVFFDLENLDVKAKRKNGEIWIQVGNNANSFNRHMDILKVISKFSAEKVRIFIPMSYGNDWHNKIPDYIDLVYAKAIEYFGEERVTLLRTLMPLDEYSRFLEQMDIIIVATDRQNALGNIEKCMFSGGKVYLSEKNPLYTYFNEQGITIGKFEDIDSESFSEFSTPFDGTQIKEWMVKTSYPKNNIMYWNGVFRSLGYKTAFNLKFTSTENERIKEAIREIKSHAKEKVKMNYINLERYTHKKNSVRIARANATDIVFVGTDSSVIDLIYKTDAENRSNRYRINIMGIIDWEMKDIPNICGGYNMISSIKDYIRGERDKLAIFCDNPVERKKHYLYLAPTDDELCSLCFANSYISPDVTWEDNHSICIGAGSQINSNCHLGCLVKVGSQTYIGKNCKIGNFVTIGNHVCIGSNVEIDDEIVIKDGVTIDDGVHVYR